MSPDELIREEFPQAPGVIYFNHAGVGVWPARSARLVHEFADENVRTGALNYPDWARREQALREALARFINAPAAGDIALVPSTSSALSIVACGLDWRWGDNVVGAAEEFPSNRIPWQAQRKWGVSWRGVVLSGKADPEGELLAACDARTRVLAVSSAQFGSGLRLDLARLGAACRARGMLFCVDAIQTLGALPLDVVAMGIDFAMADAHKWLLGPEGIAVFYCRPDLRPQLELRQFGWHMVEGAGDYGAQAWRPARDARRFEPGSPNMLGIFAFSASLSLLREIGADEISARVLRNTGYLMEKLEKIPGVELRTPAPLQRRAGIVNFRIQDRDPEKLVQDLSVRGVVGASRAGGVRFSPHFYNSLDQIDKSLEILSSIL